MKVGRNDPCPCGSGKKYKRCCGAGTESEKVIPFPGAEGFGGDFGGGPRFGPGGQPQTFMESRGTPNLATEALKEIQAAVDGRGFASRAELERFVAERVEARQRRPLEDFLGISPDLMHRVLSGRLEGQRGFLAFRKGLHEADLPSMPLLEDAVFLLRALAAGPLKATEAGYLPRSLVLAWWEEVGPRREPDDRLRALYAPRKESEAWELWECRLQLMAAGLISREGPRFGLGAEGLALIQGLDLDGLFQRMVETIGWGWDWNEIREGGRGFHPFSQTSFSFNLHLLGRLARDWTRREDLVEAYLRAFPLLRRDFPAGDRYGKMLHELELGFGLTHWPCLLGLVEERRGPLKRGGGDAPPLHEYRVTAVFDRMIGLTSG